MRKEIFDIVTIEATFLFFAELIFQVSCYLFYLYLFTVYVQLFENLHCKGNYVVVKRFLHELSL